MYYGTVPPYSLSCSEFPEKSDVVFGTIPLIHSDSYASDKRSRRLLSLISPEVRTLHELSGLVRAGSDNCRKRRLTAT